MKKVEPLTTDQVLAIVAAIPERYRAMVVLAAGLGRARGEVFGLTEAQVDFLRRRIDVDV